MLKEFTSNKNGARIAFDLHTHTVVYEQLLVDGRDKTYDSITSVTINGLVYEIKEKYEEVRDRLNEQL